MNFDNLNTNVDLSSCTISDIKWAIYFRFNVVARIFKIGPGFPEPADKTSVMQASRIELTARLRKLVAETSRVPPTATVDTLLMNQNFKVTLDSLFVAVEHAASETLLVPLMTGELVSKITFPLERGMPVVTTIAANTISEVTEDKVRLTPLSRPEIETINAIAEAVTLQNGEFVAKTYPVTIFRSAKVWGEAGVNISNELNTLFAVDKKAVSDANNRPVTAGGKNMINAIIAEMVRARGVDTTRYRAMCMRFIEYYTINKFGVPGKIGEFQKGSLEYAYYVLKETRGIRGGDKKDTTLAGSSFYLPVTIDNRYAKAARDVTDFGNLIALIRNYNEWSGNIRLVGKHVPTILNRLMLFEIKFKGLITIAGDIPMGWIRDGSIYTNPLFLFTLSKGRGAVNDLIIDYSMLPIDERYLAAAASSDIKGDYIDSLFAARMGPVTKDTDFMFFLPSVFVHNLTGFHTTFAGGELVSKGDFIAASIECNIARTFTMAFRDRGPVILARQKCDPLIIRLTTYTRLVKGFGDHIDIPITKNTKFADLFEDVANDNLAQLDKAIVAATRVESEENYEFGEDDAVPDPSGPFVPPSATKTTTTTAPGKKPLSFDWDV